MFVKISPQACNFNKKETLTQVFLRTTFFTEHLHATVFDGSKVFYRNSPASELMILPSEVSEGMYTYNRPEVN